MLQICLEELAPVVSVLGSPTCTSLFLKLPSANPDVATVSISEVCFISALLILTIYQCDPVIFHVCCSITQGYITFFYYLGMRK